MSTPLHEGPSASPRSPRRRPHEVYGRPGAPVLLLVGNGGAGAVGLLRPLCEGFLEERRKDYAIGWVKAGSGENFTLVRQAQIDLALTYEPMVERRLVREGAAIGHQLVFHDRFILAGPRADPAGLAGFKGDIGDAFQRIAEAGARPGSGVRFLSRDNTSATTVKERAIWALIQRDPWEDPASSWYLRFDSFPIEGLARADALGAYTLNDLGTFLGSPESRVNLEIFRKDGAILDNPCSVIVTAPRSGEDAAEALEFAAYLGTPFAQRLIADFGREAHGQPFYLPR